MAHDHGMTRKLLAFENEKLSVSQRQESDKEVINACLRLWMDHLGHPTDDVADEDLYAKAQEVTFITGQRCRSLQASPADGKPAIHMISSDSGCMTSSSCTTW